MKYNVVRITNLTYEGSPSCRAWKRRGIWQHRHHEREKRSGLGEWQLWFAWPVRPRFQEIGEIVEQFLLLAGQ